MKIKRLVIENFKSIERIELIEPNPFTVFVGPNGSGKSNIFEALEFVSSLGRVRSSELVGSLFGGSKRLLRRNGKGLPAYFLIDFGSAKLEKHYKFSPSQPLEERLSSFDDEVERPFNQPGVKMFDNFSRLFIKNEGLEKFRLNDNQRLSLSAANLEKVLKRILTNTTLKDEIFEWLDLFIPGFKAVEVDDRDELHWFEKSAPDYFTKDLISDGTYNILALLTSVYQSDEPQFLCIEEPENGLNPEVIKELVQFFRYKCEEKGHYIWLNTHSQTLVSQLTSDEIVVVDKVKGATQTKQFKGRDFHGLRMDEAWLMNVLGGGLPW
ncbi:AAA family ATPase [Spirosoma jeollabukense]